MGGRKPRIIPLTASTNFPACVGGLSVTYAAGVSDNGKQKRPTPNPGCQPAVNARNLSYGVISQTTPSLYWPVLKFVPYRLPFASRIGPP